MSEKSRRDEVRPDPPGLVPIVQSHERRKCCPDCGEPWCELCQDHFADCQCVGILQAEELGLEILEIEGWLYGRPRSGEKERILREAGFEVYWIRPRREAEAGWISEEEVAAVTPDELRKMVKGG